MGKRRPCGFLIATLHQKRISVIDMRQITDPEPPSNVMKQTANIGRLLIQPFALGRNFSCGLCYIFAVSDPWSRVHPAALFQQGSCLIHGWNSFFLSRSSSCLYKMDQFLHIVKLIVITVDAFPVIDNPILFIPLQTVQQRILAISSGKQRERIGLDLRQNSFPAVNFAFIAMADSLFHCAFSILTPVLVRTGIRITSGTILIF